MADDMGFSDLGCYGGEVKTPHINALAEGGLRFTQFYNTARCCPTRAALMTGLYPHQAQRRLVGLDYFLNLGTQAYAELAAGARAAWAELYRSLAAGFARLVRVLVEVRRLGSGHDAISALDRHSLALADPAAAALEFPGAIVIAGSRHSC